MTEDVAVENPLLRSGILLAGARQGFSDNPTDFGDEDGVLTAYEAVNLDLEVTQLVLLSACETGLGVNSNGEGVYGLQRALYAAGGRSVIMSYWKVADEPTQELMVKFYEKWLSGKSVRDPFRLTQQEPRAKYPQPYYWGAFVVVGN